MNQAFKTRFDQMRESNPAKTEMEPGDINVHTNPLFHSVGHARNLCMVWPDGRQSFFNYAYLVSADFVPGEEMNTIRLGFSSQDVIIKGYGLETLFVQLLDHLPRIITAVDKRYIPAETGGESIVMNIKVETSGG
ncbi:hypothetical protein [Dyadobacter sp. CY347]|uniref:hypothetical protein n=1 Tax=Dyadobacter sp. CY347 TaxID=2909336 RepID=UPI001F1F0CA8|nr:hypothetical protein [Dyadobacter sp. CY347]MCF2491124.1 hypothetical protein [Dyadobacter sp. CY347]